MTKTERDYLKELRKIIRSVRADIVAEILPLVKELVPQYTADADWSTVIANALNTILQRWQNPYRQHQAQQIAESFVKAAVSDSERTKSFGIDLYSGNQRVLDYTQAAAVQNAKLITSIPEQYLNQVSNIVLGNMRQGLRPSYIHQQLVDQFGITDRRAKLIARDQHAKIQGEVNKVRQEEAGFKYFRWLTAHDERVRHTHQVAGNKDVGFGKGIYRWDQLPKGQKGQPMYPGSEIQCRCVAIAVPTSQIEKGRK